MALPSYRLSNIDIDITYRYTIKCLDIQIYQISIWVNSRGVFVAGPAISEIEEIVKDTALSLIGVESLDNDEPLMDAGGPAR